MLYDTSMGFKVAMARMVCDRCDAVSTHRLTVSMLADMLIHGYTCQVCIDSLVRRLRVLA